MTQVQLSGELHSGGHLTDDYQPTATKPAGHPPKQYLPRDATSAAAEARCQAWSCLCPVLPATDRTGRRRVPGTAIYCAAFRPSCLPAYAAGRRGHNYPVLEFPCICAGTPLRLGECIYGKYLPSSRGRRTATRARRYICTV